MRYLSILCLSAILVCVAAVAHAQSARFPSPGEYDAGFERASAQPPLVIVLVSYPAQPEPLQLRAHTDRVALNCAGDSYWEWDISEAWGDRHLFEGSGASWRLVRDRLCRRITSFSAYEGEIAGRLVRTKSV